MMADMKKDIISLEINGKFLEANQRMALPERISLICEENFIQTFNRLKASFSSSSRTLG